MENKDTRLTPEKNQQDNVLKSPICKGWMLITNETDTEKLIDCCLRKQLPSFIDELKKWSYYRLREVSDQLIQIEQADENCQPFESSSVSMIPRVQMIGWEYCCDVKIKRLRDTE